MSRHSSPTRHRHTPRPAGRNRPIVEPLEGRALLAAAGLSFVEPLSLPLALTASGQIQGVAKGDFNRDGKLDLAVTYSTSPNSSTSPGQVAFLAGNGDGTFAAPVNLTVPASQGVVRNLDGILAKDFNRDGKLDLVVAEPDQSTLLEYQGNGDGSFAAATILPAGAKVDSIQTADLNGDGTLDLVGLDQADNTVTVLLGKGDGTFSAPTVYANVGKVVTDMAIGDVDGKNGPDVVLASHDDKNVNVLLNDGTGHFGPVVSTATDTPVRTVTAADFLGNGTTQVVIGSDSGPPNDPVVNTSVIEFLKPNGDGTFALGGYQPEANYPSHYDSENVAPDLNGDGRPDLLFGHTAGANFVTVGLNRGDGTFDLSRYVASPGPGPDVAPNQYTTKETSDPAIVLAGDFHGTGVPDIIVGSFADRVRPGGLSLLPAVPSAPGTYRSPRTYNVLPPNILAPFGHAQLLGRFGPNGSQALVSLVTENFTGPNAATTPAVYLSAVNADGTVGAPSTAVATFGGSGSFYTAMASADFNGDGKPDLVYLHGGSAQGGPAASIVVATNNGDGTFTSSEFAAPASLSPQNVAVGDFNGDGKPDLAVLETTASGTGTENTEVDVYLNNGSGGFSAPVRLPTGFNAGYGIAVGDFNGDGKADIVANHSAAVNTQGDVELFKGNGDGTFAAPVVIGSTPNGNGSASQFLGVDLRHNGRLDLVGIGGNLQVYLNNGDGTFAAPVVYAAGAGPNDFRLADLNGDGNLDAAVATQQGLFVLAGNGDGTFGAAQQFSAGQALQGSVNVGDVNGDGRPDVLIERFGERAGDVTTVLLAAALPGPSADFVIGSDGQVYTHAIDGSGNPTGGYLQLAYGQVKDLAVTRFGDKTSFEAFVIGLDGQGYAATISGSTRSGYFHTAYGSTASVSAGTDSIGNPLLFAIGTDHQLYEQKFNAAGVPTSASYTKAAFGDFKRTVLTHDAGGNPLLYAVGQDGQVYGLKLDASGSPAGGLFKVSYGPVQQLAVAHDAANTPELFVVGTDNAVYGHKLDASGGTVGGYFKVGGLVYTISATNDAAGNPELFAVGTDGQVYGHKFDGGGNPSAGFFHAPDAPGGVYSVNAGSGPNNNPALYVAYAADANVYAAPFNPSGDPAGAFMLTTAGQVKKVVLA